LNSIILPSLLEHGVSLTGEQLSYYSSKKRKEFLVLTCGQRSVNVSISKGKNEDRESCSDEDSEDEEKQTVSLATFANSIYMISSLNNNLPKNMAFFTEHLVLIFSLFD